MKLKREIAIMLLLGIFLASCQTPVQPTVTSEPKGNTPTPGVTYLVVTNTPTATAELPTATQMPTATATMEPVTLPDYSGHAYIDDRSTPAALIFSYINAINRHEYLRAYSYWPNPGAALGTLDAFTTSFNNVESEIVTLGQVTSEGAAGSIYFTIPAALTDNLTGGGVNKFAVCYTLRFPQPANYGAPPIQPMHFDQMNKVSVDSSISDTNIVSAACPASEGLPIYDATVEDLADLSDGNFIDNRSGPVEVISSLLNAINRKEYVRAYSYWENPTQTYTNFANGYADTVSVTAIFGTVISDAGAGQFHYQVPVAEYVLHTDSTTKIYVGCYVLHLSNPGMQGMLPFEPMGIVSGKFTEYPAGTNVSPLLTTVCQ
jgi:hypothetical protein